MVSLLVPLSRANLSEELCLTKSFATCFDCDAVTAFSSDSFRCSSSDNLPACCCCALSSPLGVAFNSLVNGAAAFTLDVASTDERGDVITAGDASSELSQTGEIVASFLSIENLRLFTSFGVGRAAVEITASCALSTVGGGEFRLTSFGATVTSSSDLREMSFLFVSRVNVSVTTLLFAAFSLSISKSSITKPVLLAFETTLLTVTSVTSVSTQDLALSLRTCTLCTFVSVTDSCNVAEFTLSLISVSDSCDFVEILRSLVLEIDSRNVVDSKSSLVSFLDSRNLVAFERSLESGSDSCLLEEERSRVVISIGVSGA